MTSFCDLLQMNIVSVTPKRVELTMPITPEVLQVWGFLHGGATLALLETAASYGAAANTNPETERPFGINVNVSHRKSGKQGSVRGVATLEKEELSRNGGRKQFWQVYAYNDEGEVLSEGRVLTMVSSIEYLKGKGIEIPQIDYSGPSVDNPVI